MTGNGLAQMFTRMNLLWGDPIEADREIARTWYQALQSVDDDAVFEALPILAQTLDRRPSIAQIVQQAKAAMKSRALPQLPAPKSQTAAYMHAWRVVNYAQWEHRLSSADCRSVIEKHQQWFMMNGEDSKATAAMVAEVEQLAAAAA